MSYEINYLIDTPGARFNKMLRTGAPETGVVTLLWIPVRYSSLLAPLVKSKLSGSGKSA